MINNSENIIEGEKEEEEIIVKIKKEFYIDELEEKYNKLKKNNSQNYCNKERNNLKKLLENSFAINIFDKYINNDFLDNCEYKLVFMPEEFNMKEDDKFYFSGFCEKRKKKINYRNNKNNKNNNKISPITEVKKNKKKFG